MTSPYGGECVARLAPNGGIDRVIDMPVSNITTCVGGPDLATLYVMSADAQGERLACPLFAPKPGADGKEENVSTYPKGGYSNPFDGWKLRCALRYIGAPAVHWEIDMAVVESSLAVDGSKRGDPIKVFVQLAHGQNPDEWAKLWASGKLLGLNDPSPYGYARANAMGCEVTLSTTGAEGLIGKITRLGLRFLLGFDYVHARRNTDAIAAAEIVWTHTESQFLAVAAVLSRRKRDQLRPKLLGQSVWLIDKWPKLFPLQRAIYRRLINRDVDILTFLSPDNLAVAKKLFPGKPAELVLFGIPSEVRHPLVARSTQPIKVMALGNDRHRDWETAVAALGNQTGIELTIVSGTAPPKLADGASNVRIIQAKSNEDLNRLFAEATVMLVPLKPNKHASGITVIEEAALHGLPTISSDVGGLRAYFGEEAVCYVPHSSPDAILSAVRRIAGDPQYALAIAQVAQNRMAEGGLGAQSYIARHVDITRRLVKRSGM